MSKRSSRVGWLAGAITGTALLAAALLWLLAPAQAKFRPYPAPSLRLPSLTPNALPVDLAALRGKPVVLNFFFSGCPPCRTELPLFESTYRTMNNDSPSNDTVIIGVDVEDASVGRPFVKQMGLTFPVVSDDGSAAAAFNIVTFPATVFISADGIVRHRTYGAIAKNELQRELHALSGVVS